MLLFLPGLVTGLVVQQAESPRMGLAAHLGDLVNGTYLLALGAAFPRVRLSARAGNVAFGTALCGAHACRASTMIAAALGTIVFGNVAPALLLSSTLFLRVPEIARRAPPDR